jgi:hypothetical protein
MAADREKLQALVDRQDMISVLFLRSFMGLRKIFFPFFEGKSSWEIPVPSSLVSSG